MIIAKKTTIEARTPVMDSSNPESLYSLYSISCLAVVIRRVSDHIISNVAAFVPISLVFPVLLFPRPGIDHISL